MIGKFDREINLKRFPFRYPARFIAAAIGGWRGRRAQTGTTHLTMVRIDFGSETGKSVNGATPGTPQPSDFVLALLRCPGCRGLVRPTGIAMQCIGCGTLYPLVNGVPVLIDDTRSVFRAADIAAEIRAADSEAGAKASLSDFVRRLTPGIDHNYRKRRALSRMASLCKTQHDGRARILVLWGLQGHSVTRDPPRWDNSDLVHAAVLPQPGAAVSCDPQQLPFADQSFDALLAFDVLHQVLNPDACAAEIHRVLVARGLVYAETPFVQPVHQSAYDFQRFTSLGHRRVFRHFEEVESGVGAGPGAALAWAWRSLLGSLGRSRFSRFALRTCGNFTGFFLHYLDAALHDRPASHDAAASVYFLGHRSQVALSDQELVAGYRGAARTPRTAAAIRPATEVFSAWAAAGRDQGMAKTHAPAVHEMLDAAISALRGATNVTAIDIGCGNGWVVRMLRKRSVCSSVTGVDGSAAMIAKARSLDPEGDYVLADLSHWTPSARVNLVHSMEVLYYLNDPAAFLRRVCNEWLEPGGVAILGIDHYAENEPSLVWPGRLGVRMTTWPEDAWRSALYAAGFSDVRTWRAAPRGKAGTLAMLARAPLRGLQPAPTPERDALGGSPVP
jgi:SAM-dependent methyltransferase